MTISYKYTQALASIPSPGGNGCHTALLGTATLGIMAGLTNGQIFNDIRSSVPAGNRRVADREINDAINRARLDTAPLGDNPDHGHPLPFKRPPRPLIRPGYRDHLIQKGAGATEQDFIAASPIPLHYEPAHDAHLLLETLYKPADILFIGKRYSTTVRPVSEWLQHIDTHGLSGLPHIIPNPVTGNQHPTQTGKLSFRCDNAIQDFRYCVAEFDDIDRNDQLAFWATIPLPITALIDSGGKSIHAWIQVEGVNSNEEWTSQIETELYARRLIPLGVDPACKNEARLSRLPGHYRDAKSWQRLLYLNSNRRPEPILSKSS